MKKNILVILIIAFGWASCEKVLDVQPIDKIEAEDAVTDLKGLRAAMAGVYDGLQTAAITQDVTLFPDLAADNLIHVGTKKEYRQISDNRIVPSNVYVTDLWSISYDIINRANNILVNLNTISELSQTERNSYQAQLLFLRAYSYFNLVKFFGGVPIKELPTLGISPEEINIPRNSKEEVYAFIVSDLTTAADLLEGTGKKSVILADEGAIRSLLARVYLYTEDWQNAYDETQRVMAMDYSLEPGASYANIFSDSLVSDEIIYQINFTNDDENNSMADWTLPDGRFEAAAWETQERTTSIFNVFNENDLRRDATVQQTELDNVLQYYCNKYRSLQLGKDNIPVFRLAEIYLIAAEALNELGYVADGEAFGYLNDIRTRAGLEFYTSIDLPDQQSFRLALEQERRLELAFEGHRYFDLVRTGRATDVLPDIGPLTNENQFLFPIPQNEMDTNLEMEQNPEY